MASLGVGCSPPRRTTGNRPERPGAGLSTLAQVTTAAVLVLGGCGGAAPLMHPAHALASGEVSAGAGVSGRFVGSKTDRAVNRGRLAAERPLGDPATAQQYATGVITDALVAAGASPWVGVRVGLPANSEAGMTYTGRSLRLDGRHVLVSDQWALSFGLGASAVLRSVDSRSPADSGPTGADTELEADGWGVDLPIIAGYRSLGDFVDLWAGGRFGYERLQGELRLGGDADPPSVVGAEASRWWVGVVSGFAIGVPPVWLRFELETTFHKLSGELDGRELEPPLPVSSVSGRAWSVTPSAGLLGKF